MATWFEPNESWPEHGKGFWRASLDKARRAGWRLKYVNAPHLFGFVYCPSGQHKKKVDKTARDSALHAAELGKKVDWCRCPRTVSSSESASPEVAPRSTPEWAARELDRVGDLLDEVARGLRHLDYAIEARDRLDRALRLDAQMDVIEGLLELADAAERAAPTFEALDVSLEQGEAALHSVEAVVTTPELEELRSRHAGLVERVTTLKERIRGADG